MLEETVVDAGQWIAIGLSIFLGVWFVIGGVINRRKGVATYQWLREALERIGQVTEARWIGSSGSGARMVLGRAAKPFRRVEVVFLLESREIMPLWLVNRLRDKRDEMILKATLRSVPTYQIELAREGDRKLRSFLAHDESRAFSQVPGPDGFLLARKGHVDHRQLEQLVALVDAYRPAVRQISVQRSPPHLIVRLDLLPLMERDSGATFFSDLQRWLSPGGEATAVPPAGEQAAS